MINDNNPPDLANAVRNLSIPLFLDMEFDDFRGGRFTVHSDKINRHNN